MGYSFASTTASGSTPNVSVPFPYLDKAHVHVMLNESLVADNTLVWLSDSQIQLASTPTVGTAVKVFRATPADNLMVIFTSPSNFDPRDLNQCFKQLMYIVQEALDSGAYSPAELASIISYVNSTLAAATEAAETANTAAAEATALLDSIGVGGSGSNIANVLAYGAVGDGSTDDKAAINTAIAYVNAAVGRKLYFPGGRTYKVSGALDSLNTAKWPEVYGDGQKSTIILTTSATANLFTFGGGDGTFGRFSDMAINSSVTRTAGSFVKMTQSALGIIERVKMNNVFWGIEFYAEGGVIRDCSFNEWDTVPPPNAFSNAEYIRIQNCDYGVVIDNMYTGVVPVGHMPFAGINIIEAGAVILTNSNIIRAGQCLNVTPSTSGVYGILASNCYFDNSTSGVVIAPTGSGVVRRCSFTQCNAANMTGEGFAVNGASAGVRFDNCLANSNGDNGFLVGSVGSPSDISINNCTGAANGNYGLWIGGGISDLSITDNSFGAYGGLGGNGAYGILMAGATDHYVLTGNRTRGNGSGGVSNTASGTDKIVDPAGSTGVSSFNSRTGAVTPGSSDYSVGQISGAASLSYVNSTFLPFSGGTLTGATRFNTTLTVGTSSIAPGYSNTTIGAAIDASGGDGGHVFGSTTGGSAPFSSNINSSGDLFEFWSSGSHVGYIATNGSNCTYNSISDYRVKKNIEPLTGATERFLQLKPSRFNMASEADDAPKRDGFIAHEVSPYVPEAVTGEKDAMMPDGTTPRLQAIDPREMMALTVATLQEALARITVLEGSH